MVGEDEYDEQDGIRLVFVVEDGTGVADANSYVTVEFADEYFRSRGVGEWEGLVENAKKQALIRATDFIDNMFQWLGNREFEGQALRFPRVGIRDYDGSEISGIPQRLKQAVCEAAVLSAKGTELFQTQNENGDVVSETITTLSFTYSKDTDKEVAGKTLYDAINTRLRGLYRDSSKRRAVSGKVERV